MMHITSFPYLAIAREFGIDYGRVLLIADAFKVCHSGDGVLNFWQTKAIMSDTPSVAVQKIYATALIQILHRSATK